MIGEENAESNLALRELCDTNNEYFGAIGIYFPGMAAGYSRYPYRNVEGIDRFLLEKGINWLIEQSEPNRG